MEEKKYTLEEARRVLKESECVQIGHLIQAEYVFSSSDPVSIHCLNCGVSWKVGSRDE